MQSPVEQGVNQEPQLPRVFGRYQLFDHIGRGGMADIFLARMATDVGVVDRLVVVKLIHRALSRDEAFSKQFIAEAKLCAGLRHGNIVQVLDLGREDGLLFMAMEYVEGLDLLQLLRRLTREKIALPREFALFVVLETLSALDFAHRAKSDRGDTLGIVHRDVSPSNVLVSIEGEVKLCDFGIAKATNDQDRLRDELGAKVVGKSAYMAPEHARGEAIDGRADVFAAGILLWELCAGRRLYRGTETEMLELAKHGDVPPLPEGRMPEQELLEDVLRRALAVDPNDRFPTARAFRDELEAYTMKTRLRASPLRFGEFLTENVGVDFVLDRRARERGAKAVAQGPLVTLTAIRGGDATEVAMTAPASVEDVTAPQAPLDEESASHALASEPSPQSAGSTGSATTGPRTPISRRPPEPYVAPRPSPWLPRIAAAVVVLSAVGAGLWFAFGR